MSTPDTIYTGVRLSGPQGQVLGVRVEKNGRPLSPARSQKLRNHSPDGFEWGYLGSGPSQLALALVLDATGDQPLALAAYQWFKHAVVNCWGDRWAISAAEIDRWVDQWRRERRIRAHREAAAAALAADAPEGGGV